MLGNLEPPGAVRPAHLDVAGGEPAKEASHHLQSKTGKFGFFNDRSKRPKMPHRGSRRRAKRARASCPAVTVAMPSLAAQYHRALLILPATPPPHRNGLLLQPLVAAASGHDAHGAAGLHAGAAGAHRQAGAGQACGRGSSSSQQQCSRLMGSPTYSYISVGCRVARACSSEAQLLLQGLQPAGRRGCVCCAGLVAAVAAGRAAGWRYF